MPGDEEEYAIVSQKEFSNLKKESKETQRTVNDVYLIADATLKKLNIVETEFRTLRDAKLPRISKVVVAIAKKKQNVAS